VRKKGPYKDVVVSVRFPERIKRMMEQVAYSEGLDLSAWVRNLVIAELKRRGVLPEAVSAYGLEAAIERLGRGEEGAKRAERAEKEGGGSEPARRRGQRSGDPLKHRNGPRHSSRRSGANQLNRRCVVSSSPAPLNARLKTSVHSSCVVRMNYALVLHVYYMCSTEGLIRVTPLP